MYKPQSPPASPAELTRYVYEELQSVSAVFALGLAQRVEFLNNPPEKPREGMVYGADGTNWNPGAGKGVYAFYSNVWNKLG
jgi:hypothetical protein